MDETAKLKAVTNKTGAKRRIHANVSRNKKILIKNMSELVPKDFQIPETLEADKFRLRMLTIRDIDLDYEAVMSSIIHLQETQPFGPDHKWPTKKLTHEQDLIDLGWHQKEFQNKTSFAYTVMSLDESICLGCLYIYPPPNSEYDAMIMMWVRESDKSLDEKLFNAVKQWVSDEWPFKNPGYPGREINWEEWKSLSE